MTGRASMLIPSLGEPARQKGPTFIWIKQTILDSHDEARRFGSKESNSDWKLRWAILFTGSVSLTLWTCIGGLVWFVIRHTAP